VFGAYKVLFIYCLSVLSQLLLQVVISHWRIFMYLWQFWSELPPQARQKLLRIDKQALFEQARKNMYCSRCNGLLLEGFMQIVMYGKSLQQEGGAGHLRCDILEASKNLNDCGSHVTNGCQDEIQDPSVYPWGGLTTTRDGSLTLLKCYLFSKSLKGLQNVSAKIFLLCNSIVPF
jgi:hypothetical protein